MKRNILITIALLALTACNNVMERRYFDNPSVENPANTINTSPATTAQCPGGGYVVTVNGASLPICNGLNGSPGTIGQTGLAGSAGSSGANGQNGTSFITGIGSPGTSLGVAGDTYVDLSTFNLYTNNGGTWSLVGNIRGATGTTGPQGSAGSTGSQGPAGQNGTNGTNGTNGNGYVPGIECMAYSIPTSVESGIINWAAMFAAGTPKFSAVLPNFNTPNESNVNDFANFTATEQAELGYANYALDCEGYINVPETGVYVFKLGSDDGSQLAIDDQVVINMPQDQAFATANSSNLTLFYGPHKINVLYFQGPPVMIGLQLSWQGPANAGLNSMSIVPSSVFMH